LGLEIGLFVCVDCPALRARREREREREAERKMGLREDAAESRMKKKVEEGSLLMPRSNFFSLLKNRVSSSL
jgi:hypothetical protein